MKPIVTLHKLDHTGRTKFTYTGELEYRDTDSEVVRCRWDKLPAVAVGLLSIEPGDVLLEYYYRHHWFNIFALYTAQGELKGWYCNIAETVEMGESLVRWRDLALDLVVLPDGRAMLLDEDEFAALALDDRQEQRAYTALGELHAWVAERHPPFEAITTAGS
jgi:predicted RNA-binding protein associated with RNAse of E/G family